MTTIRSRRPEERRVGCFEALAQQPEMCQAEPGEAFLTCLDRRENDLLNAALHRRFTFNLRAALADRARATLRKGR
jgi:hypothetical protein